LAEKNKMPGALVVDPAVVHCDVRQVPRKLASRDASSDHHAVADVLGIHRATLRKKLQGNSDDT
jgi:hypothetical protein